MEEHYPRLVEEVQLYIDKANTADKTASKELTVLASASLAVLVALIAQDNMLLKPNLKLVAGVCTITLVSSFIFGIIDLIMDSRFWNKLSNDGRRLIEKTYTAKDTPARNRIIYEGRQNFSGKTTKTFLYLQLVSTIVGVLSLGVVLTIALSSL